MRTELLSWEGGEHEFALPLSALEALQDRMSGDGVGLIFQRLSQGTFKAGDVVNTLILGLEGGGMKKSEASTKVSTVYESKGLNSMVIVAQIVISTALNGWPDDEPGEAGAEALTTSKSTSKK